MVCACVLGAFLEWEWTFVWQFSVGYSSHRSFWPWELCLLHNLLLEFMGRFVLPIWWTQRFGRPLLESGGAWGSGGSLSDQLLRPGTAQMFTTIYTRRNSSGVLCCSRAWPAAFSGAVKRATGVYSGHRWSCSRRILLLGLFTQLQHIVEYCINYCSIIAILKIMQYDNCSSTL